MAILGIVARLGQPARSALHLIRSGVRQNVGADTLYRRLRTSFPGLVRSDVRIIARAERLIIERGADLRFLNLDKRPNPARLPPSLTSLRKEFSYRVRLRGFDSGTGESIQKFVTVTSDDLLTRGEIEGIADDFVSESAERYALELQNVQLVEAMRAGPEGVL